MSVDQVRFTLLSESNYPPTEDDNELVLEGPDGNELCRVDVPLSAFSIATAKASQQSSQAELNFIQSTGLNRDPNYYGPRCGQLQFAIQNLQASLEAVSLEPAFELIAQHVQDVLKDGQEAVFLAPAAPVVFTKDDGVQRMQTGVFDEITLLVKTLKPESVAEEA